MKVCPVCKKEYEKKTKYCSKDCQMVIFTQSQKGKKWSEEKKQKLSGKLKVINNSSEVKEKRRATNLERYGGNAPACSEDVKGKIQATSLERYGFENPMQSEEVKETAKKTMAERYGGFTFQSAVLKEKVRQTNLERYGSENPFGSKMIQDQIKQTNLERYGSENPMQSEEVQNRGKMTCMERFGFVNPLSSPAIREQIKKTNLINHGTTGSTNRHLSPIWTQINSLEWWSKFKQMSEVRLELSDWLSSSGIELYTHRFRPDLIGTGTISRPHQRVIDLLNEHQIEHQVNNRSIISPLEIDIYIPSKLLAVEVNGAYWHSEVAGGKDKNYHLIKTNECEKRGINLLQFWDFEIENKWDIVRSMLLTRCGITNSKIGARQCNIIDVDSPSSRSFFKSNHLQGNINSKKTLGLTYKGEIVSCMSFSKTRYNKDVEWEITRFSNKKDIIVSGAFTKLLKHFNNDCVSYSDRRYSLGNIYKIAGFALKSVNSPSYYYTNDYQIFHHRTKFQKHKLLSLLETFDPSLTEWENMKLNGYDRVWDCGTMTWIWKCSKYQ